MHEGGDLHGDGVNIAARLEQMSDPGGLCISGTVFDQLRSTIDVGYEGLGGSSQEYCTPNPCLARVVKSPTRRSDH